ncbi:hypothetical protein C8R44DRAFT_812788 [Mycena epipterygia]|nr:hypothetical protein C8R44DRAFT_812788 [Mycena epipterygia]
MESELITNKAHGPGFTCLAFSRDGVRAFTGGDDCIVRIWKVAEGSEQEPATAAEAEKGITSIALSDDSWLAAGLDADVRRYTKDTGKMEGIITNTGVGVATRCVAIDPRGQTVAVASDEHVRLIDMDDPVKIKLLEGHRGGVRKVTWHPTAPLLTTCGSDGQIIVWDVSQNEPSQKAAIQGIIATVKPPVDDLNTKTDDFLHDCSAIWHTSGDYFFVPSRSRGEIVTIRRSDWKKHERFSSRNAPGAVTALAVSVNGAYLASASEATVHVWCTSTHQIIAQHSSTAETIVTQLAFSPTENLIAWTATDGAFNRWAKPIPDKLPGPVKPIQIADSVENVAPSGIFDDDDVEAEVDEIEVNGIDAGDEEFAGDAEFARDAPGDWIDDVTTGDDFVKEMVSITKAQPPFQPGATPMVGTKQYLAMNRLGTIIATAVPDTAHHVVDIKFHDQSKRQNFHFQDPLRYNLGDLGERGALFACKPKDGHPARVYYRPYGSNSPPLDWTYALRSNSRVLGVAAGGLPSGGTRDLYDGDLDGFGNVVIATTEGDLTFLSGTGRERRIMGLGGDFVSMVAGHEWVFVVHRAGSTTIDGSQNLSYTLINFDDFSVRQRDFLPIPKGHILKWIGVTEEGAPAMYDTTGRIHVLTKYRIPHHASWARVMDTNLLERKIGKDETYWPIGINGSSFMCIILKGAQYPQVPYHVHQELPIELPFRSENKSEEKIERETVILEILRDSLDDQITNEDISRREQLMDKEFVLLIQSACQKENVSRAIELAKLIHNAKFLDSVVKISQFYHLTGLTEKIQMLKKIREEGEDRLILARDKRRQWTRPDPLPRSLAVTTDSISSRPKPFQDFGPPPMVSRPGLAPAIPAKETTRYTANTSIDFTSTPTEPSGSPPENKRKRDEVEDITTSLDFVAPPPKQKINPFARKVGQDHDRNPFARKPDLNKTIQKSESFFDKVDAAEQVAPKLKRPSGLKPKDKDIKKDGPRQTTLFGMMASSSNDRKSRVEKKPREMVSESHPIDSDIAMTDATLVETQPDLPEEWEETQPVEAAGSLEETQPATP